MPHVKPMGECSAFARAVRLTARLLCLALLATGCGDSPTATEVAPRAPLFSSHADDGYLVYVANAGSGTVSVISTATNDVVGTIAVGPSPRHVAVTSDGRAVWVTFSGGVAVINAVTRAVEATIPMPTPPNDVVITPDGSEAWVTNILDGLVTIIDVGTRAVLATIPVAARPFNLAFTPDGSHAYMTHGGDGGDMISVISTAGRLVVATLTLHPLVGSSTWGVAVTPDGGEAWVATLSSIVVISTATNTAIASMPVNAFSHGIAMSSDGERAYVANFGVFFNNVHVIATATRSVIATVPVGVNANYIALTPDDELVYVTNRHQGNLGPSTVSVISTATHSVVATVPVGSGPWGLAVAPVPGVSVPDRIDDLADVVDAMDLPARGTTVSLLAKLDEAMTAWDEGRIADACQAMQDFINQVNALSGRRIPASSAADLIDAATQTRAAMGC
jgi:YVTN family beta-propeller protein